MYVYRKPIQEDYWLSDNAPHRILFVNALRVGTDVYWGSFKRVAGEVWEELEFISVQVSFKCCLRNVETVEFTFV